MGQKIRVRVIRQAIVDIDVYDSLDAESLKGAKLSLAGSTENGNLTLFASMDGEHDIRCGESAQEHFQSEQVEFLSIEDTGNPPRLSIRMMADPDLDAIGTEDALHCYECGKALSPQYFGVDGDYEIFCSVECGRKSFAQRAAKV